MTPYDFSIVIPVFNRGELVRHTIASVRRASTDLKVEIILVDDGSTIPVEEDFRRLGIEVEKIVRQPNQGLLFARLAGLEAASGRHVLFLDSDDLISANKLSGHLKAFEAGAEVTYSNSAHQLIDAQNGPVGEPQPDEPLTTTADGANFFLTVQPAPHSPAFDTAWLRAVVAQPLFPPSPLYNAVAEIWFYHVCAPLGARVRPCVGFAIVGTHDGTRLTNHWEKLGVASLAVQEAFVGSCPLDTEVSRCARGRAAAKAFGAWRRLPRGFSPAFADRLWAIWRDSPERPDFAQLGGASFRWLARLVGPAFAARLLHRLQAGPYDECRTMDDESFAALLAALPAP